jgi:transposase
MLRIVYFIRKLFEGSMAHPDWALKFKAKGTELRNIGGRYYLYRISSKYDKERKVTRKITHEMIGTITEESGLIPKGHKKKERAKQMPKPSVKEWGATACLQVLGQDIFEQLAIVFPDIWREIAVLAMNRLLYQAPLKNNEFLYNESFISEMTPNLKLDRNSLTILIRELGAARDKITTFLTKFVSGHQNIVFDSTHIFSNSHQMKMNAVGYNSKKDFDPQVNLFYMFSVDTQQPVYYRIFPGNIGGTRALKLSIKESGVENCTLIGDKGFASEENFTNLENEKLHYIFPLKRDSKLINYRRLKSREYSKAFDGHFLYNDRPIFYYQTKAVKGRRVVVFHDAKLKTEEEATYLRRAAQELDGYDLENYQQKQLYFGTMSMITNIKQLTSEEMYIQYKHRMEIETLFDCYKNLLAADSSYMHSDAGFEAWSFINHISIMLYYKLFTLLKSKGKLNNLSPADVLLRLTRIFKIKIKDQWHTSEINSKTAKLLANLQISVT